jgi:hypothetical protein
MMAVLSDDDFEKQKASQQREAYCGRAETSEQIKTVSAAHLV